MWLTWLAVNDIAVNDMAIDDMVVNDIVTWLTWQSMTSLTWLLLARNLTTSDTSGMLDEKAKHCYTGQLHIINMPIQASCLY